MLLVLLWQDKEGEQHRQLAETSRATAAPISCVTPAAPIAVICLLPLEGENPFGLLCVFWVFFQTSEGNR